MRGLQPAIEGQRISEVILRRDGLRFPFPLGFAERLRGHRIESLARRAKYILATIESGDCLLIHLGMTGRFTVFPAEGRSHNLGEFYFEQQAGEDAIGPHDHVIFLFENGTRLVYTDPRRFGIMDLFPAASVATHKLLRNIGIEPMGNEMNAEFLSRSFRGRSAPLKAALLDQHVIAGLGNIYVCEALHRAGLSPKRKSGSLARTKGIDRRLEKLVREIRGVLAEAIAAGGSTLQDFAHADGSAGAFQQRFLVYDREGEPCSSCGKPIKRLVQSGRSTFYCTACQK